MNRIFLIHGYVEDPTIFDVLVPLLPPSEVVRLDLADEFVRWQPARSVSARTLAQYLTEYYKITPKDTIIGHSMGGWVAINIKEVSGAKAIQLASWTDQKKIRFPTSNLTVLRLLLDTGITQSNALTGFFRKKYSFDESRELYNRLVEGMQTMPRQYLWQQLQTLFVSVAPLTVQPDLRIHARADNIVAPPAEPYAQVPGDHFSLIFHAELVAKSIAVLIR